MPLTSFGRAHDSVDETSVVKGVVQPWRLVGPFTYVAGKLGIDLAHIDGRVHGFDGDDGPIGLIERDAGRQVEVSSLKPVGMITGQVKPSIRTRDLETEASILQLDSTDNLSCECSARSRRSMAYLRRH